MGVQARLFDPPALVPDGFVYRPEFITVEEERELLEGIGALSFSAVEMHGGIARRRVVHFGWSYGFDTRSTTAAEQVPPLSSAIARACGRLGGTRAGGLRASAGD